jgi:hypothetical protein
MDKIICIIVTGCITTFFLLMASKGPSNNPNITPIDYEACYNDRVDYSTNDKLSKDLSEYSH